MGTWLEALIRTGALRDIDAAFISKTGERIPILFSRTAVVNAEGAISDIICIAKNMRGYRKVAAQADMLRVRLAESVGANDDGAHGTANTG